MRRRRSRTQSSARLRNLFADVRSINPRLHSSPCRAAVPSESSFVHPGDACSIWESRLRLSFAHQFEHRSRHRRQPEAHEHNPEDLKVREEDQPHIPTPVRASPTQAIARLAGVSDTANRPIPRRPTRRTPLPEPATEAAPDRAAALPHDPEGTAARRSPSGQSPTGPRP